MRRVAKSLLRWLYHPRAAAAGLLSTALWIAANPSSNWFWLIFVALVPLLHVLHGARLTREATIACATVGFTYYAYSLYPLVSAVDWTGWMVVSEGELVAIRRQQSFFLHSLWVLLSLFGALLWGVLGAFTHRVGNNSPVRLVVFFASMWLALCEGLRVSMTWGFHWDFLGTPLIGNDLFRQGAALGGIRILSLLVLAGNIGIFAIIRFVSGKQRHWLPIAGVSLLLVISLTAYGAIRLGSTPSGERIAVSAVQHSKDTYTERDFAWIGIDRSFLLMLEREVPEERDLIVLPETISFGALSLDQTASEAFPGKPVAPVESWSSVLGRVLRDRDAVVVIGVETVSKGKQYNSLGLWSRDGVLGWYSKRRLVPFAEYFPQILGSFSARGESRFSAGTEASVWNVGSLRIGAFICQEVLFPSITRDTTRAHANVLVSGGNDGVFSNPRVARTQALLAQLRATENDRPLIRAMKTGRSAIIDQYGRELVASKGKRPEILNATVHLADTTTLFVRFGEWILFPSWAFTLALLLELVRRKVPSRPGSARV